MLAGGFLGINFRSIDANLENTAAHRDQCELADVLFELQQLLRQTDGSRFVISNTAIFDFDFDGHNFEMQPKTRGQTRQAHEQKQKSAGRSSDALAVVSTPKHVRRLLG